MNLYKIAALALLLASCGTSTKQEEKQTITAAADTTSAEVTFTPAQLAAAGISTGYGKIAHISRTLSLQGKIDVPPQSAISLSFPLGGYLRSTDMLPGAQVRKGQVLAKLEDMQFIQLQQDYLTAKEKFIFAEAEYARQHELNASKAASDKVVQQSRADMETQRILMRSLAQKLQLIGIDPVRLTAETIRSTVDVLSPVSGFVSKVNVNVGKYTSPTDVLFELVDPRDIHLMLHVFEKDLQYLSVGQQVAAYTNNAPNDKILAEIILISKSVDENRMAEVHCHFRNYHSGLAPGMFMNGDIALDSISALTVPEEAIVRWENKFYVFEETKPGHFKMMEVTPGAIGDGLRQIDAFGITDKNKLVIKNAYAVLMKLKNAEEGE